MYSESSQWWEMSGLKAQTGEGRRFGRPIPGLLAFFALAWLNPLLLSAQQDPPTAKGPTVEANPTQGLDSFQPRSGIGLGGFGGLGGLGRGAEPYRLSATYSLEPGGLRGRVEVEVELNPDYVIYSVTQPKGGPLATQIALVGPGVKLRGPFVPDQPPKVSTEELGFEGVRVEKHFDRVTWSAPLAFDQANDGSGPLALTVDGQVCKTACITLDRLPIQAVFKGFEAAVVAESVAPFRDPGARTQWLISLSQSGVQPGQDVDIILDSETDSGFHIYAVRPTDSKTDSSTVMVLSKKGPLVAGAPIANAAPTTKELIPGVLSVSYHPGSVQWRIRLHVPEGAAEGIYPLEGLVGYQACTDDNCEEPLGLRFQGELTVSKTRGEPTPQSLAIAAVPYREVVQHPARLSWIDEGKAGDLAGSGKPSVGRDQGSLDLTLLLNRFCLAVIGGFLLNFMPCVLPVIGLKVMSFVKESDRSGASVVALNMWYIAGIMTVFLGLAAFTIGFRAFQGDAFGWGEQFGSAPLRIGLTILMFAMALSFLGVWEIPIPGFATSQTSTELMQREGPVGAYCKGLLTTVLATPCSGPGLAAAFAVAISQPAWVIVLMYLGVGLGMSLPFVIISLAPGSLNYLPKPGVWMQTLKEFLAFPMLFAIVWLFLTTFTGETLIAVVLTLVGVWFACWWIGRVPGWVSPLRKFTHWGCAVTAATLIGYFSFQLFNEQQKLIRWIPYSEVQLAEFEAKNKTVMIDFTAQWCANCKLNLLTAIETQEVAEFIEEQGIVPMLADFTDRPPEIKAKLHQLESNSIPVLAIYPAGRHAEPIVLRDLVSKQSVLAALRQAQGMPSVSQAELAGSDDRSFPTSVRQQAPP